MLIALPIFDTNANQVILKETSTKKCIHGMTLVLFIKKKMH